MTDEIKRRSPRLSPYDYTAPGWYLVTLVVQGRALLLGDVVDDGVRLSAAGEMASYWWREIPNHFKTVALDMFVFMPNHLHGIVIIGDPANIEGTSHSTSVSPSLSRIMQWFKTMTTNAYMSGVREHGWSRFERRLWQHSFYDHIVGEGRDIDRIRD
jgi:REP element-mobilizing transposase RayT